MPEESGTLERIAESLANALMELSDIAQPANLAVMLNELGIDNPPDLSGDAQLAQSLSAVMKTATELMPRVEELILAVEEGGTVEIVTAGAAVIAQCAAVGVALDAAGTQLQTALSMTPGGPQLAAEFAKYVIGDVIARYLDAEYPLLRRVLTLAAVLTWDVVTPETDDTVALIRRRLHIERLPKLLSNPLELLESGYSWGRNDFHASLLLQRISELFEPLDAIAAFGDEDGPPVPPVVDFGVITLSPAATTPPGLCCELFLEVAESTVLTLAKLSDEWDVVLDLGGGFREGLTVQLVPPTRLEISPLPSGALEGHAALEVVGHAADTTHPIFLLGIAGASRMEAQAVSVGIEAKGSWGVGAQGVDADVGIRATIKGGRILVLPASSDGFLATVLPQNGMEVDFDLKVGWSSNRGLHIEGGGLAIAIPIHRTLGPILLDSVNIGGDVGSSALVLTAGLTAGVEFGPVKAVVEDVGLRMEVDFSSRGNLGVADLDLGFKPPNGVGLAIDASVVKGGGFLRFDPDKEQYDGVLELDLNGIVSVKAIGLITTRLPDGSQGFSLLLIITAEFGSPIQLGLGFTLSGVGGLLGLNRTMRLEVIATGIRDGGINSIMFPQNVIQNAPRIISDLKKYFPVEADIFLIGPMLKIGWGTPNLVTVSLGVIIEIPGNIAILGVLKVALPDEDNVVVLIQVNFMGAIEFDKKRLWFFASMYDSRVLFITLEGQMGLLVGWGDEASFVVSVGGFHPAFNPPPLPFGVIARIALSILNTDYARIRVEAYFAVTSNTVQFGAAVEVFFGVSAFNIDGHLAFDALFRFSPFYFIITISASLSVKVFGIGLFSVHMRGSLEGPTPWHIEGTGSISLLFFDIDVDFSHTWGTEEETTLPPISVMPLLTAEFQKLENWQAVLPANNQLLVSLRSSQSTTDLILHPVGSLKVSQRAVPLGITIDKVGNQKPADANHFSIIVSTSGLDKKGDIEESFAVGQYLDKSDSELLNAKSFEPMKGGVELSVTGEQYHAPAAVKRVVRYEEIIIDSHYQRFVRPLSAWFGGLFSLFLNGNTVSKSALSRKQQQMLKPFADMVEVGKPLYTVARVHDNTAFSDEATAFTSQAQAQEFLKQQIATDANLAKQLHVIPQVEMQRQP